MTTILLSLAGLSSAPAFADDGDLLSPRIFSTLHYDSNYFRLPSDGPTTRPDGTSTGTQAGSALTREAGVGLVVNKSYGLQNFLVDASVTRYSYSNFDSLNATGHHIDGRYDFKITPAIGGALIYKNDAVPTDQADTGFQTVSNIRTITLKRLDTDWLAGAALHPRISVFEETTNSDLPLFQLENSKTRSVSGSLIYLFPSNNTVEAYYRKANGSYQDLLPDPSLQLATSFRERQTGVRVLWVFNGLTILNFDAGYLDRTHDGLSSRNFSGFVGYLSVNYELTGKTHLQFFAQRLLYSSQSIISSYASEDQAKLTATWKATNVISVIPELQYSRRLFQGATIPLPVNLTQITRGATLEARWAILRRLDLSAIVGIENRAATLPGYQFTNRSAEIKANLHF